MAEEKKRLDLDREFQEKRKTEPVSYTHLRAPQSPRRARGSRRASLQAGQSQKKAGTPHPAAVPMNVNVCFPCSIAVPSVVDAVSFLPC